MPLEAGSALGFSGVPHRPKRIATIESCRLFNDLPLNVQARLAARSFMAYAEKGEMIWMTGTPAETSSIVGVGFVRLSGSTPNGRNVTVEILGPGQSFGLMEAIEGRAFPLSATAVTNCWYLKIPTRALSFAFNECDGLRELVIERLADRQGATPDLATPLSSGVPEQRLAAVLLTLAESYGIETADGTEIPVPLARQDLGDMASTTIESTIRILSLWQSDGLVSTSRPSITIREPAELLDVVRG